MPTVDSFTSPSPDAWVKDPQISQWLFDLQLLLDNLTRPDGALEASVATTAVVVTQGEKLDFITLTQAVNLDTIESESQAATTALSGLQDSLPKYTISNDGTDRTLNANAALGSISNPPTQAEVENIRDAVLDMADNLATVIRDLKNKDIFGV